MSGCAAPRISANSTQALRRRTQALRNKETLGLLLGLVGVMIFAATLPMTRLAVGDLGAWFLTAGRAAVAGIAAMLVLKLLRRPLPARAIIGKLALAALCLVGGFPGFSGLAMQSVPAAHGAVVIGVLPLATAAASALLHGERPSAAFWICGVAGAALIVLFALRQGAGGLSGGDLLLFGAVLSAAVGYTISADLSRMMPGWEVISWAVVLALPVTLPAALWLWPAHPEAVRATSWGAFAYISLMSMYAGFFFWNAGLAMGGVARVSQVQLLQTFFSIGIAAALNGEPVGLETLFFALAVAATVFIGRLFRVSGAPAPGAAR